MTMTNKHPTLDALWRNFLAAAAVLAVVTVGTALVMWGLAP
jgi:hypothetical protein